MNRKSLVTLGGCCLILLACLGAAQAEPVYVMHEVQIRLDQVSAAAAGPSEVGGVDHVRIVYDRNTIDPKTHRVRLINFQHFIGGTYRPEHPDSVFMPMNDAWLDLSRQPYRLHFHAAVTHGMPIIIDCDARTRRLTIHPQNDPHAILLSGRYHVDSKPIQGEAARSAAGAT